jgi:hypothetical protein
MSGDNNLTTKDCFNYDLCFYNTVITSNGIITCDTLNANNGYFAGNINSDGYFNGKLECNKAVLTDAILKNPNFVGDIILNSGSSYYAFDKNDNVYLNIFPQVIGYRAEQEYPIATYSQFYKNTNGTSLGQIYYPDMTQPDLPLVLMDIMVPSGSVVTIPKLKISAERRIPSMRTGKSSSINVKYKCGNNSGTLGTLTLLQKDVGKYWQSTTTSQKIFTATTSSRLTITIDYAIHLPSYSWCGADKATVSINLESVDDDKITVEPDDNYEIKNGVAIGTDGFMARYGRYGFRITKDKGIQILSNGQWELLQ